MGNHVYANMREVSCKAAQGKSICAFPDVCFTPPENPTTPPGVPIPYPNTGMASDTTKGTRKVKITKKEAMIKNKSYFKKSMGDEAGSAAKKGVVTSTNRGKVYFTSWSMDVKFEGSNVVRMMDTTTHNHMSVPGNTPIWPYVDRLDPDIPNPFDPCAKDMLKASMACKGYKPYDPAGEDPCKDVAYKKSKSKMPEEDAQKMRAAAKANDCLTARKCELQPYKPEKRKGQQGCCQGQTAHHIVEKSSFKVIEEVDGGKNKKHDLQAGNSSQDKYNHKHAPCICAEGPSWHKGSHAEMHTVQGYLNSQQTDPTAELITTTDDDGEPLVLRKEGISYANARDNGAKAVSKVFPESQCDEECIKSQLDAYHKDKCGVKEDDKINAVMAGNTEKEHYDAVLANIESENNSHPATGM